MLKVIYHKKFIQDVRLADKNNKDLKKLSCIMGMLVQEKKLSAKYRNNQHINYWECHIEPDWLLIYKKTKTQIIFARTRSHANLF